MASALGLPGTAGSRVDSAFLGGQKRAQLQERPLPLPLVAPPSAQGRQDEDSSLAPLPGRLACCMGSFCH